MFIRARLVAVVAVALSVLPTRSVLADFELVSSDLTVNKAAGLVDFSLTFNQAPVFSDISPDGIPTESFQVNFVGNPVLGSSPAAETDLTSVIRGDEIHVGNDVRVRQPTGNGGIDSGGWGPVTAAVPYTVSNNTIAFSIPASALGWTGGQYSASIYSLNYGTLTAAQTVQLIPTPSGAIGGGVLLGLVMVAVAIQKRRARRAAALQD
jgi:hypothetical protein